MNLKSTQSYFLLVLIAAAGLLAYFIFSPFIISLALAAVFSVVVRPLYRFLCKYVRWQGLAAGLAIFLCVVVVLMPLALLSTVIAREAQQLYTSISDGSGQTYAYQVVSGVQSRLHEMVPSIPYSNSDVPAEVDLYVKTALAWLAQHMSVVFSSVAQLAFSLFILLISLYYFLKDGATIKRILYGVSPLDIADNEAILTRLELGVNSVIKGSLSVAVIQGFLTGVGFTLFGVPNSILWGVVAMMTALVPGIGTSLVVVPGIIFLFASGSTLYGFGLLLWWVAWVGLIDNFLGPRLVSRGIQLHPLVVLLSVFGGIGFFGPAGIFLGPLSVSLLFGLIAIYARLSKNHSMDFTVLD
jgi:predicted PurR-regulated permease PerM